MDDDSPKLENDMPSNDGVEEHAEELSRVDEGDITADAEFNGDTMKKDEEDGHDESHEEAHDEEKHDEEPHDEETHDDAEADAPEEETTHEESGGEPKTDALEEEAAHDDTEHEDSHDEEKHDEELRDEEVHNEEAGAPESDTPQEDAPEETSPENDTNDGAEHVDEPAEEPTEPVKEQTMAEEIATASAAVGSSSGLKMPAEPVIPVKPAEPEKKNKTAMILFIVLCVAALACVLIVAFFSRGGSKPTNQPEKKPDTSDNGEVSEYKIDGNSLSDFDLVSLKSHIDNGKNFVSGPMSMKYALSMLKDGTAGNSQKQLEKVVGDYQPKAYVNSDHVTVANAVFVRDSFKDYMKSSYLDSVKEKYNAATIYDPFNNATTLNDWVYKNTLSLIPKVLDDGDVEGMSFILANAMAIDMEWVNDIQCSFREQAGGRYESGGICNYNVNFKHEKYSASVYEADKGNKTNFEGVGEVPVLEIGATINSYDIISELGEDYIRQNVKDGFIDWAKTEDGSIWMSENKKTDVQKAADEFLEQYMKELKANYGIVESSTDFMMHDDDNVKMFAKDLKEYDGLQLQYVGIMPKDKSLKDFVKDTSAEKLDALLGKLKELKKDNFVDGRVTKVTGRIPEFKYDVLFDLTADLKSVGIEDVFTSEADLSNMTSDESIRIALAKHGAMIEFSNYGIKAASATVIGGRGDAGDWGYDYLWEVPIKEIDLTFDKPFMYLVRDKATGEVWFTGAVYAPNKD